MIYVRHKWPLISFSFIYLRELAVVCRTNRFKGHIFFRTKIICKSGKWKEIKLRHLHVAPRRLVSRATKFAKIIERILVLPAPLLPINSTWIIIYLYYLNEWSQSFTTMNIRRSDSEHVFNIYVTTSIPYALKKMCILHHAWLKTGNSVVYSVAYYVELWYRQKFANILMTLSTETFVSNRIGLNSPPPPHIWYVKSKYNKYLDFIL